MWQSRWLKTSLLCTEWHRHDGYRIDASNVLIKRLVFRSHMSSNRCHWTRVIGYLDVLRQLCLRKCVVSQSVNRWVKEPVRESVSEWSFKGLCIIHITTVGRCLVLAWWTHPAVNHLRSEDKVWREQYWASGQSAQFKLKTANWSDI